MPALSADRVHAAFAFDDLDLVGALPAIRSRIGPSASHQTLTYDDLARRVVTMATVLGTHGVSPGERVAILLPHSTELMCAFFAARYVGGVPSILAWPTVKMDRAKYERNLRAVMATLDASWLITDASMLVLLGASVGRARVLDFAAGAAIGAGGEPPRPAPPPAPGAPAFIQFSGGTTGTQKSVPITLDHLAKQLDRYARSLELTAEDRFLSWLPLYHDMGLVACMLLPFVTRLSVCSFSPLEWVMDPRPFLRSIAADRPTVCWLPNFAFSFLASRAKLAPGSLDLSSLRRVINCSEPVRAESMDAFAARFETDGLRPEALHTCYAMAETTFAVTQTTSSQPPRRSAVSVEALRRGSLEPGEEPRRELVSCGPPLPGTRLRIVDTSGADVAPGVIGEIWIESESMMVDYLRDAGDEPRRAFTGGWYRSGDLGALVDGHLYVTGRKKDLVIIGGVNVYPEDIEATVSEVPGIHPGRVVAFGLPNPALGTEQLIIVAEHDVGGAPDPALEAGIRTSVLAITGLVPSHVFVVPPKWIVKSTAGKISRVETRARVLDVWDTLIAPTPQRTEKQS